MKFSDRLVDRFRDELEQFGITDIKTKDANRYLLYAWNLLHRNVSGDGRTVNIACFERVKGDILSHTALTVIMEYRGETDHYFKTQPQVTTAMSEWNKPLPNPKDYAPGEPIYWPPVYANNPPKASDYFLSNQPIPVTGTPRWVDSYSRPAEDIKKEIDHIYSNFPLKGDPQQLEFDYSEGTEEPPCTATGETHE